MYEAVVYFAGPKTMWSDKVADEEVIMRRQTPWSWLARVVAHNTHARLDPQRVGYILLKDGVVVEHVEPELPKLEKPVPGKTARLGR